MLTEEKVNITKRETHDTCSVNCRYTNSKKYSAIVLLTIQHNIETFFRNLPSSNFTVRLRAGFSRSRISWCQFYRLREEPYLKIK